MDSTISTVVALIVAAILMAWPFVVGWWFNHRLRLLDEALDLESVTARKMYIRTRYINMHFRVGRFAFFSKARRRLRRMSPWVGASLAVISLI
jgi:hypothetical protein